MSKIDKRFLEGGDVGGEWITAAQLAAAIATGQFAERTMPDEKWRNVCWSPEQGLFCAVGDNKAATSPDGATWTERAIPSGNKHSVGWSRKLRIFCAVGDDGKAATSTPLFL